jgi:hypothetical protein
MAKMAGHPRVPSSKRSVPSSTPMRAYGRRATVTSGTGGSGPARHVLVVEVGQGPGTRSARPCDGADETCRRLRPGLSPSVGPSHLQVEWEIGDTHFHERLAPAPRTPSRIAREHRLRSAGVWQPSSELSGASAVLSLQPSSLPLTCSFLGEASIVCRPRTGSSRVPVSAGRRRPRRRSPARHQHARRPVGPAPGPTGRRRHASTTGPPTPPTRTAAPATRIGPPGDMEAPSRMHVAC